MWFILLHVYIEVESKNQVKANNMILDGAYKNDKELLCQGLNNLAETLGKMHNKLINMWQRVSPKSYLEFRTFI